MSNPLTTVSPSSYIGLTEAFGAKPVYPLTSKRVRQSTTWNSGSDPIFANKDQSPAVYDALTSGQFLSTDASTAEAKRVFQGYLSGTRPPFCLKYVLSFFIPGGDVNGPLAQPLNQETYNDFCLAMYNSFIAGEIPGVVSFDQPSYDDISAILMSVPAIAMQSQNFPLKRGTHIQAETFTRPGLATSSFHPSKIPVATPAKPDYFPQGGVSFAKGKKPSSTVFVT